MQYFQKCFTTFISLCLWSVLTSTFALASQSPERIALPLPKIDKAPQPASLDLSQQMNAWQQHSVKIKKNDTLSDALVSAGIGAKTAYRVSKTKNSFFLTNLRVGDSLDIWTSNDDTLEKIVYKKSRTHHYILERVDAKFKIQELEFPVDIKIETAAGTIKHSFYLSGQSAGMSAKTIMNLADIFSWEIDFIRQLRPGDPFKVIYEKRYINGTYVGDGDILAAEITTAGRKVHDAFLLRNAKNENIGYYNKKRRSLRKAFLRNPVDYVRITSGYKPKRFHPVLKKWRAHRGVDYGGPTGTPIRVTGDGQVIKRQWSKSYGRVIYVRHANKYVTVYAHMSRYGKYKKGSWVRQGQVIGYIGKSGMATGPHLHYEFRKNGRHVDPLKVNFPDAGPVPKKYRARFKQYASLMSNQLERLNPHTQVVSSFE